MFARSIRTRLTFWYVAVLTASFLFLGGAAYGLLSYSLIKEMDNALQGVAQTLAERANSGGGGFVPPDVDEIFRRFFGFSPFERYLQMLDPLGRLDSHHPQSNIENLPLSKKALANARRGIPTFETVEGHSRHPIRVLTMPVMRRGRLVNLVRVGMSLENVAATRMRFLLVMAIVLPIALIVAGWGGRMLISRALQPVDRMTEAARRISAEHLTERLEETGSDDELDRLAKTLNQMLARLDAAFHQVRQFSANASHELQTPLTILKGELEVTLRSTRTPEEYEKTLRSALEEIDRISELVQGLLLLSRAEAGVLRMDRKPLDLAQLVDQVCSRLKILADSKKIHLSVSSAGEPLLISGDSEHLRQLITNLVDNGIKYTPPGGNVTISIQKVNDFASIVVSDTGPGISPEEQERIFLPFYRNPQSLSEKGAGLGLSIARSIVLAHGGTIRVESALGRGSRFIISLPLQHG